MGLRPTRPLTWKTGLTEEASLPVESHAFTHQGFYRQRNEDAYLSQPDRQLWAVCDGMGGHAAGDYAAQWIVSQLSSLALPQHLGGAVHELKNCLLECNHHLQSYSRSRHLGQIGATVVLFLIRGDKVVVLWAGDSRAYRLRSGRLRQMTEDHSYAQEMARSTGQQIMPGAPGAEAITRAVGASEHLYLDCLVLEARPGDNWLLCSDGVSGAVSSELIEEILPTVEDPAEVLVDEALQNGSRDNCTAVCIRIQGSHLMAPSSSTEYM